MCLCREENPVGNWTLSVYDVDNPEATGHMLNWTLTLFGEQDPNFVGEPTHLSTSIHHDKEHEVSVSFTSTTAKPTTTDNTPSRPSRIKPDNAKSKAITTSTSSVATPDATPDTHNDTTSAKEELETESNQKESEQGTGYLTIIYSVVGSIAILAIASVVFIYKRNGWKLPSDKEPMRANDNYEFDALQPLTTELSDEEEESDNEVDRLVRNNA